MSKKITIKKVVLMLIVVFCLIQAIRIDKTITPIDTSKDLISITAPDVETTDILKKACYDCHSNQPTFPWYTNVAPVSWWIKHHIDEGRHHLNFSEWSTFSAKKKNHKIEECVEMLESNEMPMNSYTCMHKEAKLTNDQRLALVNYFKGLKETGVELN